MQSDEDEDNYDEFHCRIGQSILKERLSRLASYGSPDTPPQGTDAVEEQAAAKEKVSCEAIHKRFNVSYCYLCKNGNAKDKREERKKGNYCSCSGTKIDLFEINGLPLKFHFKVAVVFIDLLA